MINGDYWSDISLGSMSLLWGRFHCVCDLIDETGGWVFTFYWPQVFQNNTNLIFMKNLQTWICCAFQTVARHVEECFVCSSENDWRPLTSCKTFLFRYGREATSLADSEEQKVQLNLPCPLTVSFLKSGNKTPRPNLWHRSLGNNVHDKLACVCLLSCVWVSALCVAPLLTFATFLLCHNHFVNHQHIVPPRIA